MVAQAPPVKQQAGTTCPGPMTRAALLALRTAGTLNTSCHYTITDYVEGRFAAGTTITLHAVSATELSERVELNTLFDNEAWAARYNIDLNTMIEVADNQGNVVRSATTGRVASWDWGNVNVSNNTSYGANIVWTYGAARPVTGNIFGANATITLTGWVSGSLTDTEISGASVVNLTNANVSITQSHILSGGTLTLTGYTGGAGLSRTTIENGAIVNFTGSTVSHTLNNCTISGVLTAISSTLVVTAGATLSMTSSEVAFGGNITRGGSVSAFTFNYSRVLGNASSITQIVGVLSCTGTSFQDDGRMLINAPIGTVVGACTINYSTIRGGGSFIRHRGISTLAMSGVDMSGGSNVNVNIGSNCPTTIIGTTLGSGCNIGVAASATAGTLSVSNCALSTSGFIDKAGIGTMNVNSSTFMGSGRVQQTATNVRNLSVTGALLSNVGRLVQAATAGAGVTDSVIYSSLTDYGFISLTATGAAGNQIAYSSIRGITANVTIAGTNTGAAISRLTVDNGLVAFTSNVAMPNILDIGVRDQGSWTVQNCTADRDMRYSTIQSYGRWLFSACTVAGAVSGVTVQSQGNLTHSGAAGAALHVVVELGGTIAHNGGTLSNAYKRMAGTLTTGAFNHSNIGHEAAVSKTLTVANASRVDYQGLATQLV